MPGFIQPETLTVDSANSSHPNSTFDENGFTGDPPSDAGNAWRPLLQDATAIMVEKLPPIVQVVEGIIAEQSKLVIGSGSKSFKTWMTIHAALCISHGKPFLGRSTTRSKTLYVNLELKPQTFKRRVQVLAKALGITVEKGWLTHLPLRGQLSRKTVFEIICNIIEIAKELGATVVVIDPLYKLNLEGDENSSHDQTILFNHLDRITTEAACTLILNDHFSKGNQSEKDPLDAIRGSSAKGGDVDAAMVLRKHEVDGCFRVDLIHRELPPVESFVIGWAYPLMELRPDLDPDAMKKAKGGHGKKHDPVKLLSAIYESTKEKPVSVSGWADTAGISRQTLQGYLPGIRSKDWIKTTGDGNTARQYITDKGREAVEQWRTP